MSKRMSDERLAEIDSPEIAGRRVMTDPVFAELLQALKVEKKRRKELEEELDQALADVSGQTDRAVVAEYKLARERKND